MTPWNGPSNDAEGRNRNSRISSPGTNATQRLVLPVHEYGIGPYDKFQSFKVYFPPKIQHKLLAAEVSNIGMINLLSQSDS